MALKLIVELVQEIDKPDVTLLNQYFPTKGIETLIQHYHRN